jgi:uncharacterized membrane protein required for colicin V production
MSSTIGYLISALVITLTVYILFSPPLSHYFENNIPNKQSRLITILFVVFLISYIVLVLSRKNN